MIYFPSCEGLFRIIELRRVVADKMAELRQTVALRDRGGLDAAVEVVQTDRGEALMERARRAVGEMEDEEARLLEQRAAAHLAIERTITIFGVTTGMAAGLLLVVSYLKRLNDGRAARDAEAVRQSESWLSTTLTSIGDAVIATDGTGRVKFLNPIAESLTGWTQAEAAGRPIEEVFHILNEQTGRPAENPTARVIREGVIVGLANHTIVVARDGTETAIEDSAAPIRDRSGEIVGVVMVFQDASGRRRHERDLRAAKEEAEAANRAKDDFLAVLSHELRTPLNPILMATTAMLDYPLPPEDVRPTLEMIRRNVNLQARLIDDLLDVMRIARGKLPLNWGVCDGHDIIGRAVDICRSEALGKSQHLTLDLPAEGCWVQADSARLQQVLWNLLKNAIKFTPEGGTIAVRTRNDDRGHLVIEVADTGTGIEPEAVPRIFDAFHQGDARITRKFGGLGLGLAICRGIVEAHGGTIAAESSGPGKGTTFRIALTTLPGEATYGGVQGAEGDSASTVVPPGLNILVVEDDETTLWLIARLLGGLGHRVEAAGTMADAWEAFRRADGFDVLISDIGLPDGSGLDLMRRVRSVRPIPAIALTGYGMDEDIRRSREAGFTTHMTKPIDFTKLEATIRHVAT